MLKRSEWTNNFCIIVAWYIVFACYIAASETLLYALLGFKSSIRAQEQDVLTKQSNQLLNLHIAFAIIDMVIQIGILTVLVASYARACINDTPTKYRIINNSLHFCTLLMNFFFLFVVHKLTEQVTHTEVDEN